MDRVELAKLLVNAAENRARMHGVRLGEGADVDIRGFAQAGAQQLIAERPALEKYDPIISSAAAAFERLIDDMMLAALEIPGYRERHPGIIGEDTLRRALSRLCPLFPIC